MDEGGITFLGGTCASSMDSMENGKKLYYKSVKMIDQNVQNTTTIISRDWRRRWRQTILFLHPLAKERRSSLDFVYEVIGIWKLKEAKRIWTFHACHIATKMKKKLKKKVQPTSFHLIDYLWVIEHECLRMLTSCLWTHDSRFMQNLVYRMRIIVVWSVYRDVVCIEEGKP